MLAQEFPWFPPSPCHPHTFSFRSHWSSPINLIRSTFMCCLLWLHAFNQCSVWEQTGTYDVCHMSYDIGSLPSSSTNVILLSRSHMKNFLPDLLWPGMWKYFGNYFIWRDRTKSLATLSHNGRNCSCPPHRCRGTQSTDTALACEFFQLVPILFLGWHPGKPASQKQMPYFP